jgi:hypothetical protein
MSVVFLGIVGYLSTILYERAVAGDEAIDVALEPHAIYEYPVSMLLANAEGVEIEATVIGRSATHVQFILGGEEFVYPLDSLAKPVALELVKYPVVGIQHAEVHLEAGALEVGDLYVLEMQKRVDQIDQEIKVLQRQYAVSVGRVAKRTIQREVEALRAEQGVLQQKISERRE